MYWYTGTACQLQYQLAYFSREYTAYIHVIYKHFEKQDSKYVDASGFHMNKHEKLLQQLCQVRITFYFSSLTPNPRNSSLCEPGIASDGGKNQQIRNTAVAAIVSNKGRTIFSQ